MSAVLKRTTAYLWYLGSQFWAQKRREALERANYICQRCFKRPATEVHHRTYERVFNELATDLQPVCRDCHRRLHHLRPANDNQLSLPFPIADNG